MILVHIQNIVKTIRKKLNKLTPEVFLILLCIIQCIISISSHLLLDTPELDTVEMTIIGRDWIIGYPKHPMLPGWIMHFVLFTQNYMLAIIIVLSFQMVITYIYIFRLGTLLFNGNKNKAITATIIASITPISTYGAYMINNVTIQLPLCAMMFFYSYKIIQDTSIKNWVILSIIAGLLINTHYLSVISIFAALLAIILLSRIKIISLFIFATILIIMFSIHSYYLIHNDFMTFQYGYSRTHSDHNLILSSIEIFLLPLLVTFFYRNKITRSKEVSFVCLLYLIPLSTALIINFQVHFSSRWLVPFYIPLGFFIVMFVESATKHCFKLFCIFTMMAFVSLSLLPLKNRTSFPSKLIYQTTFEHNKDIKYISGPMFEAGAIALRAANHPPVVFDGRFEMSPWINKSDFYQSKVLYIWENNEPKTPSSLESGVLEYAKISRYNQTKGGKFLYWKIVDYKLS